MTQTKMDPHQFFFKYYSVLFYTDTITNLETGEVSKLSSTDIHLYCYFIDQFKSYSLRDQQFFESTKSIESKTPHASDKSIREFIRKFSKLGLIKYQKIKKGGKFHSNLYTSVLTPEEAKGIVSFNTIWSREEEIVPHEPQPTETNPALLSDDDDLPDFARVDRKCTQQTESVLENKIENKIEKGKIDYPWGDCELYSTNGEVSENAKSWALSQTSNDKQKAEALISRYASLCQGKNVVITFDKQYKEWFEDPF